MFAFHKVSALPVVPAFLLSLAAAPALAASFDVDIAASRAIGTSCRIGGNAFLSEDGANRVGLELGDFRVGIGPIDDASTARSTCAVALVGRLPRGYTIRSVSHSGTYNVLKSSSPDLRFSAVVVGAGLRSAPEEVVFAKGRSAYGQNIPFRLESDLSGDALCSEGRDEDLTLSVIYAASAVRGTQNSYADFDLSPGRKVGIGFEVVRCR